MQYGGRERGGRGDDWRLVRGGKTGAKYAEIEEGIPQQRVPALELFDQSLLPMRTGGRTSIAAPSSTSEPAALRN